MAEPVGVQGWIELFRSLGQALFDVLRAEAEALGEDFRRSGHHLVRGLALFGGAAAVGFWTLGVLVLALIAVLAIWLPAWAAALLVAALFATTAGVLAVLGLRQLRRLESPADHLDWWHTRLLAEPAGTRPGHLPSGGRATPPLSQPPFPAPPSPPPAPLPGAPPRIHPDDPLEEDEL
jgi:hypothetical protein